MDAAAPHARRSTALVSLGVIAAGAALAFWLGSPGKPPIAVNDEATEDRAAENHAAEDHAAEDHATEGRATGPAESPAEPQGLGYVGPDACAVCHAERAAEFRATRHFQACRPPDPKTMPAAFSSGAAVYAASYAPVRFEMTRSGDDFFETAIRETDSGEQKMSSRIDFVYGAGAATDEVYLTWHGDRLYELPIAWLHPQQEWGASAFDPYGAGDFSRELTTRCLECHNTWFEHSPGTLNQYSRDNYILGVTCETCHGPGRDHGALHEANPRSAENEAIVRPSRLSRELQMDLCASCHSNAIKHRGPAFSYRPGKPLDEFYRTVASKHPEDDQHVANQVKYLRESKCFQHSDALSCTTCHDPHQPRVRVDGPNQSECLKCHQAADCGERPRLPQAVQNDCAGCHMPVANKIQVNFQLRNDSDVAPVKRWEHRIAVYPLATQEVLLAWRRTQDDDDSRQEAARLTRSLNEHWLAEAESCKRDYRFLAALEAYRQALRLDPSPATQAKLDEAIEIRTKIRTGSGQGMRALRENRPQEAIQLFRQVLEIKPDYSLVRGKLGTAYAATGQTELAVEELKAAAKSDPEDPYGVGMLGWIAYLAGRPNEALEYYRRADAILPYDAKVQFQTGLALVKLQRWPEALKRFQQAVKIDPRHAQGLQALSRALLHEGQAKQAVGFAERAAALTEFKNAEILTTLAEVYAGAGRLDDAGDTARKALTAADASRVPLPPPVRARLEDFRDRGQAGAASSPAARSRSDEAAPQR